MSKVFRSIIKGIYLVGESSDPSDNLTGSMWYNTTDNEFKVRTTLGNSSVITNDQSQTLENKELTSPDINGADINFGTASNSNRLVLPKDTTTNLDLLTDVEGLFALDTTLGKPVINLGLSLGWLPVTVGVQSTTDNAVSRYDGTTGNLQNSGVIIDDSDNVTGVNDLTVGGNLTVQGTTTTVESTTLDVADANITVNDGGTEGTANTGTAGLTVYIDGTGTLDAKIGFDSTLASKFKCGIVGALKEIVDVSSDQTLTGKILSGNKANTLTDESGTGTLTLNTTGNAIVPNGGGTLAFLDGSTFTNTTLTSPLINTPNIQGGTATANSKIVLPTETTANLAPLAIGAGAGAIAYDSTLNQLVVNDGANWTTLAPSTAEVQVGTVQMFIGSVAPSGYLICDGSEISRTTYASLYATQGDTFGSGNGTTTFNLPDFRGRTPVGVGTGVGLSGRVLADMFGAEDVDSSHIHTMPSHSHTVNAHEHTVPQHNHQVLKTVASQTADDQYYNSSGTLTDLPPANGNLKNSGYTSIFITRTEGFGGHTGEGSIYTSNKAGFDTSSAAPGTSSVDPGDTNTGGSSNLDVTQPSLVVNFIVKY